MWQHGLALTIALGGLAFGLMKAWPVVGMLRRPRRLVDGPASSRDGDTPSVSVIVPARDEADAIRSCLDSLTRQDHGRFEIIAVNDRSEDRTGEIMDAAAAADPRIRVIHVRDLPGGWLGKCHANFVGAAAASSDWVLFTDGDVTFSPDCIRRTVGHAEGERLDHLTLFPELILGGYWEAAACCLFGLLFCVQFRPWHVRNPLAPEAFCGIGAFNLVRRSAYEAVGGHRRLRLEVGDDVALGKIIKQAGYVSDVFDGHALARVRWQVGLRGVVGGLEKNGFRGVDYRAGRSVCSVALLALFALLPPVGVLLAPGWTRLAFASWLIGQVGLLGWTARARQASWFVGAAFPVACLALGWAILRSTALALWRGGIYWRRSFHSLDELRRGMA